MPEKSTPTSVFLARGVVSAGLTYLFTRACLEFHAIAWGTGAWWGEYSLKWGLAFFGFVLFSALSLGGGILALWRGEAFGRLPGVLVALRSRTGPARLLLAMVMLAFPVWLLQYTPWGVVFSGPHIRWLLWVCTAGLLAYALSAGGGLWSWRALLASLLLTSGAFSIAFAMINVIDYPFSLGWSEGNRMWDYSMMFGRDLYRMAPDAEAFVLLDAGRQFIGGVPFLLPGVTILAERFWVALTSFLPYILLGLAAFRREFRNAATWLALGLWAFLFLKQGPIHPPLVMCALSVALLWRGPLWLGIPLIFLTGYFAEESRFTWLFAPAIWIGMLEFSGASLEGGRIPGRAWWRALSLGVAGAIGGYFGPAIVGWVQTFVEAGQPAGFAAAPSVSITDVTSSVSAQPLLWYRLFPNATYGYGILLGLAIAALPLGLLLVYLSRAKIWRRNRLQGLALLVSLAAFLAVGLIVSTKIGGGGDLHNLDMFLIGLFFTAVIAWHNGGGAWFKRVASSPAWIKVALAALLVIPGLYPLANLRSYSFAEDASWLVTLTDVSETRFLYMLPAQDEVDEILETIRAAVEVSKSQGEVLFMDQRQLLTFGYIRDIPFVPEYEKKVLMNEAMSGSASYFSRLYLDLAERRFSLIVSEPLRSPVKDSTYQFGEENNAWVKWVVEPVLCYYEPVETYRSVQIQLLVPKQGKVDCSSALPVELDD